MDRIKSTPNFATTRSRRSLTISCDWRYVGIPCTLYFHRFLQHWMSRRFFHTFFFQINVPRKKVNGEIVQNSDMTHRIEIQVHPPTLPAWLILGSHIQLVFDRRPVDSPTGFFRSCSTTRGAWVESRFSETSLRIPRIISLILRTRKNEEPRSLPRLSPSGKFAQPKSMFVTCTRGP